MKLYQGTNDDIQNDLNTSDWGQFRSILPLDKLRLLNFYIVEEVYNILFKNFLAAFDPNIDSEFDITASSLYGSPVRELGKGSFGKVFLWEKFNSKDPKNNKFFAVKSIKINNKKFFLKNECKRVFREFLICYNLQNDSIVKVYDLLVGPYHDEFLLIQEYIPGVSLKEAIPVEKLFYLPKFCDYIFKQIVILVKFLHDHDIGHNDLKPANIILNLQNFSIKLVDFGLSRFLSEFLDNDLESSLLKSGTSRYLPPELNYPSLNYYRNDLSIKRIIKSKDTWCLGLIYYNMISKGNSLWEISHPSDIKFNDYKERNFIPKFHSIIDYLNNLANSDLDETVNASRRIMFYGMLHLHNNKRVPIEYILDSYWFQKIPNQLFLNEKDFQICDDLSKLFEFDDHNDSS